ncbi:hypothetical protein ABFS82_14G213500 [Erythranthe guttata]|nr:PREDICTED: G-type lectin S-receptor-like serine/threonine-protein kinase RLK1 [Erythranthe guttata]|eukprot:XP_012828924.1 PREDICTED: G-type lectin S-receptor-like serine/threonine-protein kinase RLK1 [Erythranthe guttata]
MASFAFFSRLLSFMALLIIAPPLPAAAQSSSGNVTLGSSLVADSLNSTWKSPSGEFAFGFRQVSPGGYLVAIWFDEMPERTIIWSANRNNLVQQASTIQLFSDGRFELNDPTGRRIWAAGLTTSGVAYAAMLDSGDFVLAANSSAVMWRSFDDPTDTLLPSQIFNQDSNLIAAFSDTNHSSGRFQLGLQTDGNLVLYTRNFPMGNIISAYWSSQTPGDGFQLIFNQSGYIYLTARNGTMLNTLSSNGASASLFHQRLTLDYDGVLRHYVYPKSANSTGTRPMAWSVNEFLPSNLCLSIRQDRGGGACGFNSLCSLGTDQRPKCVCPTGYSLLDPNDRLSGCKQDFVPQSCNQESNDTDHYSFSDMPRVNWPLSDYASFGPVSEDWCRQDCLNDCFCSVAIYGSNGVCWKKRSPLSNGVIDPSVGGKALVKIRKNDTTTTTAENPFERKSSNRSALIVTGSVLLGSSVFLNLLLLSSALFFVFRFKGRKSKTAIRAHNTVPPGVVSIRSFGFDELKEATNGFNEEIGSGAWSTVYKGTLKEGENVIFVAVKKPHKIAEEADQEFKAEVSSISRTNHKNLVQLLGYCDEGQNRLLVYEYMPNGSLAEFLFENPSPPNWYRRVQIAFATARGLCYLHEECTMQIIHCDIKPQNVLLDGSHVAKISDFGLAKLLRADQTRTNTGIRGTRGYVAPEWFRNMPITAKVDVYSYGILLLELLCCRKNFLPDVEDENVVVLADWAYDCYRGGAIRSLAADDEVAVDDLKLFEKFVMVAIWCVQEDPALRPHMKRVMHMLEGSVEVPAPPDPTSFVT